MVNVTEMEKKYLGAIANSEYGDKLGDQVWSNCIRHGLGASAPGVAASLVKKGLIQADRGQGADNCTNLTDAGIAVVRELKLTTR